MTSNLMSTALNKKMDLFKKALLEITYMEIEVSGSSMEPYLFDGESIVITHTPELLESGDIILFYNEHYKLGLHRLLEERSGKLLLKGDNSKIEELINKESVIGKMVSKSEDFNWTCERVNKTVASKNDSLPICIRITNSRLSSIRIGESLK